MDNKESKVAREEEKKKGKRKGEEGRLEAREREKITERVRRGRC